MRVTYHAYLRPRMPEDTHGTIYIRVTCERKHAYVNTFIYLERQYWNPKKHFVLAACPDCQALNDLISIETGKVRRALIDFRLKGNDLSHENIKKLFIGNTVATELVALAELYNAENNVSATRKSHMKTAVNHAISAGVPELVQKITGSHMRQMKIFLDKKMKKNTTLSILKRLKSLLNFAIANQMIERNPMDGLKIGEYEPKMDFLQESDVKKLHTVLSTLNNDLAKICKMFLFCCYTGLRFSDAMNLKKCRVIISDRGKAIFFEAKKTTKKQYIPLLPEAEKLLPDVIKLNYTNQYYNRALKEIGTLAKIATPLSSHLARHTFATIGLNKGITIDTMQALLGHSNIKTTQGYAFLMDKTKRDELSKWQ